MSTTADALLRAISDRPADDTPRLVYADHLEDAGDAARAAFIRTQVELARLPTHHPDRPALEDREHDLLAAHEADWLGDLLGEPGVSTPGVGGLVEWHWERGFLHEVAASPQWLLDHGDALFAAHPVTRWRVLSGRGGERGEREDQAAFTRAEKARWAGRLEALDFSGFGRLYGSVVRFLVGADLGRVRELDLPGTSAALRMRHTLLRSTPLTDRLDILRLGGDGEGIDFGDLTAALAPARLTELALPNAGLTAAGLRALLISPVCRDLTRLDVSNNPLGPDGWRAFDAARCRLRALDLTGTGLGEGGVGRALGAASLGGLRALELNGWPEWDGFDAVVGSPFWRQAEDLRMHSGPVPSTNWTQLFQPAAGPPGLRALDLSDNFTRDAGPAALAAAEWAGSLEWLAVSYNEVTDAGARAIADSGRFARLRTLHLGGVHPTNLLQDRSAAVTAAGVRALADAPSLAAVRLLVLNGAGPGVEGVEAALNSPHWRLSGLGLANCDLPADAVRVLAGSPRLWRLDFLDLSYDLGLGDDVLMPLAESPHLCPLLELDIRGVPASDRVRQALRQRLGKRLSE